MNIPGPLRSWRIVIPMLAISALLAGCSREEEAPTVTTAPVDEATPTPTAAGPAVQQAPANPTLTAEMQRSFADANAALKAKEYERAVQTMLAATRNQQLSEQQALAARNEMLRLQATLAGAIANGDPQAKAAAEMLRRSATVK